jgi:outer membrane biosynthesis protein TonB
LIKIDINEDGSVTPGPIFQDTAGMTPQVREAARSWKFPPPTAKGKPVKTSITAKVSF